MPVKCTMVRTMRIAVSWVAANLYQFRENYGIIWHWPFNENIKREVMTIMHVANHLLDDRLRPPLVLSGVFIHLLYVVVSTSRESQDKDPKKRGANCAAIGMRKIRTPKIANTSLDISLPGLLRLGNQLLKHTPNSHNSLKLPPCKQTLVV